MFITLLFLLSIPWLPSNLVGGEGNGTPLQYSCLENPVDGGDWWAAVHGVAKSRTRLSIFTFTFHFHALEKEMATHSSILAWRILWTEDPGGLPSMGSHRVGHDWATELNWRVVQHEWSKGQNGKIITANLYWVLTACQAVLKALGMLLQESS